MPNPKLWGKCAWDFLTYVILNYPINPTMKDKQNYYLFLFQLQYVLPCNECQINMSKHLELKPLTLLDLESKETLLKWRIDLQNMVNEKINKPKLSYSEALKEINELHVKNFKNNNSCKKFNIILIVGLSVVLIFFVYLILNSKKKLI
jgi:hypothetical protein